MSDSTILTLPRLAVGQILDALYERLKVWRYTDEYLQTGYVQEPYCIEECSGPEEAREIADYYAEIIESIEKQLGIVPRECS